MFSPLGLTTMARALMAHSGDRMALVSQNMANADTPGFKAQDLPDFAANYHDGAKDLRATRSGHLTSGTADRAQPMTVRGAIDPNGNSVSVETEMARAADIRMTHDMATAVYQATSNIIRASLDRK
jgi:flagellar basal-body rod protein FlgB